MNRVPEPQHGRPASGHSEGEAPENVFGPEVLSIGETVAVTSEHEGVAVPSHDPVQDHLAELRAAVGDDVPDRIAASAAHDSEIAGTEQGLHAVAVAPDVGGCATDAGWQRQGTDDQRKCNKKKSTDAAHGRYREQQGADPRRPPTEHSRLISR